MRMAQLPPDCGEESTSGGKLRGHYGRRNPACDVRFARDDSGRSHPPAPHPRRARVVHHRGLPSHDDAADCQEGRGRRGHDLPALRLETAPAERAVPGGGTLGGASGKGSGRAQGGSPREAGGAGPGTGRRSGAGAGRRAVVLRATPCGPARRRESQGRPRLPPRSREPHGARQGGWLGEAWGCRIVGRRVAWCDVARDRAGGGSRVAREPRGRGPVARRRLGRGRGAPAVSPGARTLGGLAKRLRIFVAERAPPRPRAAPHARRSVNSSISGGANTRIGTPTTPMPRLTYSWLSPRWKCPITYLVISRPGDHPIPGR